jgi:Sugar (pentulose and hexulose) kinases
MSLMGIDIGTTGTKAIVFDENGSILASDYKEYNLLFPEPGWVEFDTVAQWKKIFDVLRNVNAEPAVLKDPVSALAVSTFGEGITPIDEKGNVIFNTIYSTDARSTKELEFILSKYSAPELFNLTGFPPGFICPLNKILWIKNNRPQIFKNTKKILFTDDLLAHKLGVEQPRINYALASRTLFFDVRKKKWSEDILDEFDIDIALFSKPAPSGIEIGKVSRKIAEELGFKTEVSVVSGCHDQPCAALGAGAVTGGIAADGMGTVECATICMEEAITNDEMLANNFGCQAHGVADKYVTLAYNLSSGSVVRWFRDNISDGQDKTIREISAKLDFKPSRLFALPYFSATGTPYLDPVAKGSLIGLDLGTTREDIFKALIEGLVFEICLNLELVKKSGIKLTELRANGGGAKSDYELKLKASLLDRPILRMDITEAGCLATMMLAGVGTGKFTLKEALSKFVKVKDRFEPDDNIKQRYIEKYEKYKKIYGLVSELYK